MTDMEKRYRNVFFLMFILTAVSVFGCIYLSGKVNRLSTENDTMREVCHVSHR